jgi:hypothetical protein
MRQYSMLRSRSQTCQGAPLPGQSPALPAAGEEQPRFREAFNPPP